VVSCLTSPHHRVGGLNPPYSIPEEKTAGSARVRPYLKTNPEIPDFDGYIFRKTEERKKT